MKKTLCLLLSLALCLPLSACGEKKAPPFDPEADAKTLLETPGVFTGELEELDKTTACALYGIREETVDSYKVYVGNVGVCLEELAIFSFSSPEAAQEAVTCLQYRLEDQQEAAAGYAAFLQGELSKLDGAVIQQRDNSVLLVVAADYGPMESFLEGGS